MTKTIKQILVHPKDKWDPRDTAGIVYKIPCTYGSKMYIGETARKFGVREKRKHQVWERTRRPKIHQIKTEGVSHGIA